MHHDLDTLLLLLARTFAHASRKGKGREVASSLRAIGHRPFSTKLADQPQTRRRPRESKEQLISLGGDSLPVSLPSFPASSPEAKPPVPPPYSPSPSSSSRQFPSSLPSLSNPAGPISSSDPHPSTAESILLHTYSHTILPFFLPKSTSLPDEPSPSLRPNQADPSISFRLQAILHSTPFLTHYPSPEKLILPLLSAPREPLDQLGVSPVEFKALVSSLGERMKEEDGGEECARLILELVAVRRGVGAEDVGWGVRAAAVLKGLSKGSSN